MFAGHKTDFLNYVRTISLTRDSAGWEFDTRGSVQPFEDLAAYEQPQPRMKFTVMMLEQYCRVLGLDPLNPDAYGPECLLIRSAIPNPPGGKVMSLTEVREWLRFPKVTAN